MKLTPTMERFILHWGEMGSRWGVSRSVAQVHALLYMAKEPLHADDITDTLSIARSNVSMCLKELQGWGLVEMVHAMGDRRDHFTAEKDVWELMTRIVAGRKEREFDPLLATLQRCRDEAMADDGTDKETAQRIEEMHDFVRDMTSWYDQVRKLPRPVIAKLMSMGAKVARFVS
ncbi:MAG: MarR family transcriptional regulator [Alphaproteobacteria bacterium]|jgi:DNA-binding transcriptional regulator GbsR (MarR family)|nr:MarR family transcriptional regulator [Rhodospirillaceae bacterium]MDG2480782.1 MarR family transcriptional regulator [Alphaproteobacteria bacterium]MBT6205243.1 MarR family transcriptional regulator [Rhodospirillaceae bacterium]MBT6509697.1 MarR family transcriptional regulator [Rhodospirillaceae bacterium]MBT7613277.1 MarR family transcriptional regulator [Rhodospirillaceae bacterium]